MNGYESFHFPCLLDMRIPELSGDVVLSLSNSIFTTGDSRDHIVLLEAGALLWVDVGVPSVADVVRRHMFGDVRQSPLRSPLGLTLGLSDPETGATTAAQELQISRWLAKNVVVSWRLHGEAAPPVEERYGWFNDQRYWEERKRRREGRS